MDANLPPPKRTKNAGINQVKISNCSVNPRKKTFPLKSKKKPTFNLMTCIDSPTFKSNIKFITLNCSAYFKTKNMENVLKYQFERRSKNHLDWLYHVIRSEKYYEADAVIVLNESSAK